MVRKTSVGVEGSTKYSLDIAGFGEAAANAQLDLEILAVRS
jgi:hypothetical protein